MANTTVCATNKLPAKAINEKKGPKTVINSCNTFSCNVGKKLADKIFDKENYTFLNYLSNCVSQSIYSKPPELNKIINSTHYLNVNKSIGNDNTPAFPLEIAATIIAFYMQCFLTFRLAEAYFLKTVPLLKLSQYTKKAAKMI